MRAFSPAPASKKTDAKRTPRDFVLEWLAHLTPKDAPPSFSWADYLQDFFTDIDHAPDWAQKHKIRFAVTLRSRAEKYLVVIKEARDTEQAPIYIVSISVPRSDDEIKARTKIQKMYGPASDTVPKRPVDPLQTIWVESFDMNTIAEVLARAGMAVLRWELRAADMKRPGEPAGEPKPEVSAPVRAEDHVLGPEIHGSILSHQAQTALINSLPGDFPERRRHDSPEPEHKDSDEPAAPLPE